MINSNDDNMIRGSLDNSFDLQEGDQVFFLAPGEQIELIPRNDDEDSEYDSDEDSDYEETDSDEDDDEDNEEEERHQFYRQQAAEWQEYQELEEAKAEQLYEDEWRYREMFEDEIKRAPLTQEEIVMSDIESDTDVLDEERVPEEEETELGPPPVLRRERASDYLTPVASPEVSTPTAPRANRRVLRDITNIVPRRLRFNN